VVAPVHRTVAHPNGQLTIAKLCPFCGFEAAVTVPAEPYHRWDEGKGPLIQDCLPNLSVDDREVLISGSHSACYDDAFLE
jgi:hypothetical protein